MTSMPDDSVTMPRDLSLRYDRPADALQGYITGYHVYAAGGAHALGRTDWFLPGTANIRFAIDAGPIAVTIGARTFSPVPTVALFGPTTHALRAETHGGVMIGIGVSALGWARLTRTSARSVADRIAPVTEALSADFAGSLYQALVRSNRGDEVKPILDTFLAARLVRRNPDEPAIRAMLSLLANNDHISVERAAEDTAMSAHQLRRIATHYFGLTPKALLIRARFLRALLAVKLDHDEVGQASAVEGYHDASHFLKDAARILGMPPKRFLSLENSFLDASLRTRAIMLGSATQALHPIKS